MRNVLSAHKIISKMSQLSGFFPFERAPSSGGAAQGPLRRVAHLICNCSCAGHLTSCAYHPIRRRGRHMETQTREPHPVCLKCPPK